MITLFPLCNDNKLTQDNFSPITRAYYMEWWFGVHDLADQTAEVVLVGGTWWGQHVLISITDAWIRDFFFLGNLGRSFIALNFSAGVVTY